MPNAFWIRIVIGLAAAAYLVLAYGFGVSVDEDGLQYLAGVTFLIIVVLTVFDLWLWRLLPFAITKRPRLYGTWRATLDSTWVDPDTNQPVRKTFYIAIRQTFSLVSVTSLFDISRSRSTSADIVKDHDDLVLSYVYWSAADTDKREGNPPHRGTTSLVLSRANKRWSMSGDYWTERDSRGTIRTDGWNKHRYSSFEDAADANYS
jgi:hypothetical protein